MSHTNRLTLDIKAQAVKDVHEDAQQAQQVK